MGLLKREADRIRSTYARLRSMNGLTNSMRRSKRWHGQPTQSNASRHLTCSTDSPFGTGEGSEGWPRLDVPYAVPLIGFDAYPILADADEIGVLPIDDIPSTFLARDVEASAIGPNSTDMRDGLMRIMRVGLSDAGYLTRTYLKIADCCRSDINVE